MKGIISKLAYSLGYETMIGFRIELEAYELQRKRQIKGLGWDGGVT